MFRVGQRRPSGATRSGVSLQGLVSPVFHLVFLRTVTRLLYDLSAMTSRDHVWPLPHRLRPLRDLVESRRDVLNGGLHLGEELAGRSHDARVLGFFFALHGLPGLDDATHVPANEVWSRCGVLHECPGPLSALGLVLGSHPFAPRAVRRRRHLGRHGVGRVTVEERLVRLLRDPIEQRSLVFPSPIALETDDVRIAARDRDDTIE